MADEDLDNDSQGFWIPWHWDCVTLDNHYNGLPTDWCEQQNWLYGVEYYVIVTNKIPPLTTEWGKFHISNNRVYNYLFKNPKHATIFRLRWS